MTLETILLQMYSYLAQLFYSKVATKTCSVNNVFGQFWQNLLKAQSCKL